MGVTTGSQSTSYVFSAHDFYAFTIDGGGGNDTITFHGGAEDETLAADPASVTLSGPTGTYEVTATGMSQIQYPAGSGDDTASLTGASSGTNTLWANAADAMMSDGLLNLTDGSLITPGTYYYHLSGLKSAVRQPGGGPRHLRRRRVPRRQPPAGERA